MQFLKHLLEGLTVLHVEAREVFLRGNCCFALVLVNRPWCFLPVSFVKTCGNPHELAKQKAFWVKHES